MALEGPSKRAVGAAQRQHEALDPGVVQQALDAVGTRRHDRLALGRRVPVGRRHHVAGVRREAEQEGVARARGLAHELTEVQLATLGGVGRAGVADVRVVGPDHDAGRPAAAAGEVLVEQLQRFGHVLVAHVPRVGAAADIVR